MFCDCDAHGQVPWRTERQSLRVKMLARSFVLSRRSRRVDRSFSSSFSSNARCARGPKFCRAQDVNSSEPLVDSPSRQLAAAGTCHHFLFGLEVGSAHVAQREISFAVAPKSTGAAQQHAIYLHFKTRQANAGAKVPPIFLRRDERAVLLRIPLTGRVSIARPFFCRGRPVRSCPLSPRSRRDAHAAPCEFPRPRDDRRYGRSARRARAMACPIS